MKYTRIFGMLTLACPAILWADGFMDMGSQKKPAHVVSVQGAMPRSYAVVETTIMQNPLKSADGGANQPIVTRSVKGKLERGKNVSVLADVVLRVPKNPISFDQLGEMTQAATKIVGACNPNFGAVAGAASFILDIGTEVAGNALTKCFGNDPLTLTLIELLPMQYYRIDEGSGMVVVTDQFKPDLDKYTQLLEKYVGVAENWNTVISKYNADYLAWQGKDPLGTDQALIETLTQEFNTKVKPALREKTTIELQLQNYAMHRIAVMAVNTPEGKACGQNGAGSGPWRLYVYYFIGARQTNIFGVDFCASSNKSAQDFLVQLVPNGKDQYGNFTPGGLKLVASGEPQTISFPRQIAPGRFNYSSPETPVFSWYDEMIINADAGSVTSYMFPFDMITMRNEYEQMLQEKRDKNAQGRMSLLDSAISLLRGNVGQREMSTSRDSGDFDALLKRTRGSSSDYDQFSGFGQTDSSRDQAREQSFLSSLIESGAEALTAGLDRLYKEVTCPMATPLRNNAFAFVGSKENLIKSNTEAAQNNWNKMLPDIERVVAATKDESLMDAYNQLKHASDAIMDGLRDNYEKNIKSTNKFDARTILVIGDELLVPLRLEYQKVADLVKDLEDRMVAPGYSDARKTLVLFGSWINSIITRISVDYGVLSGKSVVGK